MEIKYLWTSDYGVLKRFGVNFNHSGPHRFVYQANQLTILPNNNAPISFGANILGVSAIVGQNGAGKSTLCQAILASLATVSNGSMGWNVLLKGIVCFGEDIYRHEDIPISNEEELTNVGYEVHSYKESPFENMVLDDRQEFLKNGFIYYSNHFDPLGYFQEIALNNISTDALVYDDYSFSPWPTRRPRERGNEAYYSALQHFSLQEYHRMAVFICSCFDFLPIKGPDTFYVRNTYSGNNRFLSGWDTMLSNKEIGYFTIFRDVERRIFDQFSQKHLASDTEVNYIDVPVIETQNYLYRLNIAKILLTDTGTLPRPDDFSAYIFENAPSARIGVANAEAADMLLAIYGRVLQLSIPRQGTFMRHYFERDGNDFIDWRFKAMEIIRLVNDEQTRELLSRLVTLEREVLNPTEDRFQTIPLRITSLGFPNVLSSGEYSFMALFSRLYDLFNRLRNQGEVPERVALFIDEAEVGFHPAWSKRLFNWIRQFLRQYGSDMRFQLIMTTHNPYLLSDLPAENVVLMKRSAEGTAQLVDPGNFRTFGGNVYDLLADAFFLEDGAIGEFAKEKIQAVIDALLRWRSRLEPLNRDELPVFESDRQMMLTTIPIIADNIIRTKLEDLYAEVFGADESAAQRIRDLERELDQLKRRQP
jgi:energy-coupling factor transporter ATP-binding protein EcfA2